MSTASAGLDGASRTSLAAARDRLVEQARATNPNELPALADGLSAVASLLGRELALTRALTDPSTSGDQRAGLVDRLLGGQVDAAVLDVVRELVRSSWAEPDDLVTALQELSLDVDLTTAEVTGTLETVEDELFRFARTVVGSPELVLALSDPSASGTRKAELVHALLDGRAQAVTVSMVVRAVTGPRGRGLQRDLDGLADRAAARRQRTVAQVRVAVPLAPGQADRLAEALSRQFGRTLDVQVTVDPAVLGGIVVTVGEEVLDGSVAARLEAARRALTL